MDKLKIVLEYENEYASEIATEEVSVDDLKHCGVSEKLLAIELYLRNIYGDKIEKQNVVDDIVAGAEKKVTKIGDEEKQRDIELKEIFSDIENSEFDKNLEIILH